MKAVTRVVLFLSTLVGFVQLYCSWYDLCPAQLGTVCYYTKPQLYLPVLKKSAVQIQDGAIYFQEKALPKALAVSNSCIAHAQVYYGSYAKPWLHNASESIVKESTKFAHLTARTVRVYYNMYAVPTLRQIGEYSANKWDQGSSYARKYVAQYPKVACIVDKLEYGLGVLWEIIQRQGILLTHYVSDLYVQALLVANMAYEQCEVWHKSINLPLNLSDTTSSINRSETNLATSNPSATDDGYEVDAETVFITSTITRTMTAGADIVSMPTSGVLAELDSSVESYIYDDMKKWQDVIETKANSVVSNFEKEIQEYEQEQLQEVRPTFAKFFSEFNECIKEHFAKINHAIQDIDSVEGVDPLTNETIWFDQKGTQVKQYITRSLIREYFSEANSEFNDKTEQIRSLLREVVDVVNAHVDTVRQEYLEVYEEWGDVMISEWSKVMAYVDVIGHYDGRNQESNQSWREFLKIKKRVINVRDLLLEHPVKLHDLEAYLKEVQSSLRMLSQENGEYLYILRSRANLSFQKREKELRLQEEEQALQKEPSSQSSNDVSAVTAEVHATIVVGGNNQETNVVLNATAQSD